MARAAFHHQAPGEMRAPHHRYTWDQYLEVEESSGIKHEFFDGEIYAMAGGTSDHAALAAAVIAALSLQLRPGSCRVFTSDLRVLVQESGLATYPDVTVVRAERHHEPTSKRTALLNPTLVVEVTSDSTEEYDRRTKVAHYQRIPTLRELVLGVAPGAAGGGPGPP